MRLTAARSPKLPNAAPGCCRSGAWLAASSLVYDVKPSHDQALAVERHRDRIGSHSWVLHRSRPACIACCFVRPSDPREHNRFAWLGHYGRLRRRHRKRLHGKTAAHAVVPARRAPCCSHKGRRPRRQTDRFRHCRMNTKFCPLPDQVQTVFRPRRHKLSAPAYRQSRSDAHSIWNDITCELKAA
jgi:hypothetical protein